MHKYIFLDIGYGKITCGYPKLGKVDPGVGSSGSEPTPLWGPLKLY